jgi:putative hemolysin
MSNFITSLFELVSAAVPLLVWAGVYIFFIVASLGVARSRLARLEEMQEDSVSGASYALDIVAKSERYLLCSQVGRFISSLAAGYSLASMSSDVSRFFAHQGVQFGTAYATALLLVIAVGFAGLTLVSVQVAKTVSLQHPEQCLCSVAVPLRLAYAVFGPVLGLIHNMVMGVLGRFGVRPSNEREMLVSADELGEIVKISSESGAIEKSEQELIEGVVELSEQVARDVMTPRKDVVWIKGSVSTADVVRVLTSEAVSRVLVCAGDLDEVRGVVIARDLIRFVGQQVDANAWKNFIRPAFFVPNTKPVDELLVELREKGVHLAVVLDEHGSVDGIVTLEDLVEEIVGEIFDEFDSPHDQPSVVVREEDGALVVDGAVPISMLQDEHGIIIPEGEYSTVAGFVLAHLGHLPYEGEEFSEGGHSYKILQVQRQAVVRVSIQQIAALESKEGSEQSDDGEDVVSIPLARASR